MVRIAAGFEEMILSTRQLAPAQRPTARILSVRTWIHRASVNDHA